jgi:signal transduction histidine kinase
VDGMQNTVSVLLALARAESIEQKPFDLRQLLENCILALHHRISEKHFQIDLDLPNNYRTLGNSDLTGLLINNLVNNAIQHASRPELRIYANGDALVFENPAGEPIDIDITLLAGEKGAHSDGIGQGLFLTRRILTALDWSFATGCNHGIFKFSVYPRRI